MAKKILIVMVLAALVAGGAFAQFSVEGGVDTNFSSSPTPTLGIVFGLSKFDLLAGLNFAISNTKYDFDEGNTNDYSYSGWSGGIYAGIAPRASLSENWLLSFPLLARISFGGTSKNDYDSSKTVNTNYSGAGSTNLGFGLRAGSRASYAFSEHWSLYTGFLLNVISWTQAKYDTWKGPTAGDGTKLDYTLNNFSFLSSGLVQLGVSYKF